VVKSKTVLDKMRSVLDKHPGLEPEQFRYITKTLRNEYGLRVQQRSTRELPEYLEPSEVKDLYDAARELDEEKNTLKYRVLVHLGISTGLRVSEMLDLDVRDIKPDEGHVKVVQGKGNKDRTTYITQRCIDLIDAYTNNKERGSVFDVTTARALQKWTRQVRDRFNENTGLDKDITPHTLRHTFATMCMHKGMSLAELAVLMGHSSTDTTEKYAHITPSPEIKDKYNRVVGETSN